MNSKSAPLLFAFLGAIAFADAHSIAQQQPQQHHIQNVAPINGQHQRRWFGMAAIPAIVCPTILPDFALLEANKDLCQQDFIFDALFVHNTTGDFALIPSLYKTKPFTMHRPLSVAIDPLCGHALDSEVYCIFANRSQFQADGRRLTLDGGATLVRDSCHRKVVESCKENWASTGVTPTLQTCPKVLADYPPLGSRPQESKFLCDHEYIIEALFVHNATGEYALVHQNHKAVRALMTPTTRIPVTVPEVCRPAIDEELYCIFANGRDFSTGNASTGQLQLSSSLTMVKKACDLALEGGGGDSGSGRGDCTVG
ncbi:hypothetical protein TYRP_011814 [Tyrophagus putrescentiae]|nr:hypothetical protein TYRP_011814 [Tyrophagus putrescentiae]